MRFRIRISVRFRVRIDIRIRARVGVRVRVRVRIRARARVRACSRLMVSLMAPLDTPVGHLYVLSMHHVEPRDVQPPITSLVASGLGWGQCRQG